MIAEAKKTAVILPIEQYEKLMADLHDLGVVAGGRKEEVIGVGGMEQNVREREEA